MLDNLGDKKKCNVKQLREIIEGVPATILKVASVSESALGAISHYERTPRRDKMEELLREVQKVVTMCAEVYDEQQVRTAASTGSASASASSTGGRHVATADRKELIGPASMWSISEFN
eukprot:11321861-Karenia_brevis.AAC.1